MEQSERQRRCDDTVLLKEIDGSHAGSDKEHAKNSRCADRKQPCRVDTGAVEHHEGIFSRGSASGALFLDEIGEVSIPVQIKLLQVLQERTFSPVGSHEELRFEGRVIAATNSPIDTLRARGVFRDDFFYRLSSDVITLPPLRQRLAEDLRELDDLTDFTVARTLGGASPEVSESVRAVLRRDLPRNYPWPGNVRELEQAIRRILLTGSYTGEAAPDASNTLAALLNAVETGSCDARELVTRYVALLYERLGSYEEVARTTKLDRRTVKKYVQACP